jgi:glycosyltransferase involved in cell wall biosynthesis
MSTNPLVSIIIPCYNAENWLAEALDSCIQQTYRPLEMIIINDGSTDSSLQIIQQYAAQYPELIQYETQNNSGGSVARNRGFVLAQGQYILFFDADDLIEPETIAEQIKILAGRTDCVAACPWWYIVWNGKEWEKVYPGSTRGSDPIAAELRYERCFLGQSLLWPSNIIRDLGGWDETLWANQDGDIRMRAVLKGYEFILTDQGGVAYRRQEQGTVSTALNEHTMGSRVRVLEKVEAILKNTGRLNVYKLDLARAYYRLATGFMPHSEPIGERALSHALQLGGIRAIQGTFRHRLLAYTIGIKRKERLARWVEKSPFATLLERTRR